VPSHCHLGKGIMTPVTLRQPAAAWPPASAQCHCLALSSLQAARIRKGSRGQAITALVHVPPGDDQPPGHLGFLWYYLSRWAACLYTISW